MKMRMRHADDEIRTPVLDRKLFTRLMNYAKKYWPRLLLAVIIILAASGLELLWPQFTRMAIDDYLHNDVLSDSEKKDGILFLAMLYGVTLLLAVILEYLRIVIMNYTGQHIMHDIRMELFSHIEGLSLRFFTQNPVGRLVTRLTNDVNQLNELFTTALVAIYSDIIMLFGIIFFMFWMDVKLTLISFLVLPLIVASVIVFRMYIRPAYLRVRKYLAQVNTFIQEHVSGIQVVQTFHQEEKVEEKFDGHNWSHWNAMISVVRVHAIFMPVIDACTHLAISVMLYFGAVFIYQGEVQIGMLIAFLLYLRRFYRPVRDLSQKYTVVQDAMTSSARIFALIDADDIIPDPPSDQEIVPEKIEGTVEFKNVSFAYNSDEWVLRDISFTINAGESVAIVGVTGSGKTTIVNLLARFYEHQKGDIYIDGINIKRMKKDTLRKYLAIVPQDFFLFAGTILDNIRLWERAIDRKRAIEAAQLVNVHTFAEKLPAQYDELLHEGGVNLSTGQKQLISFARALAFQPQILILDEATSNIDSETEYLVQDALEKLVTKQTSIIIAHRLSTIKHVDRILVIDKGILVEEGQHEELLKNEGTYARLYHYYQIKDGEGQKPDFQKN